MRNLPSKCVQKLLLSLRTVTLTEGQIIQITQVDSLISVYNISQIYKCFGFVIVLVSFCFEWLHLHRVLSLWMLIGWDKMSICFTRPTSSTVDQIPSRPLGGIKWQRSMVPISMAGMKEFGWKVSTWCQVFQAFAMQDRWMGGWLLAIQPALIDHTDPYVTNLDQ